MELGISHLNSWPDFVVIALYFVLVLSVGITASCWNRGSVGGYFLAGRSMNFVLVGISLFASDQGSGHFIGLAGSGAATGIAVSGFELNAIFVLLLLGWVFVPVYIASGVYTLPEYLSKRFGGQRIRIYLSCLTLAIAIFTKVASDLYAGALFVRVAFGWSIYISIIALLSMAALYTITGGLTAVMWTEFVQTLVMLTGSSYLAFVAYSKVGGGYNTIAQRFLTATATSTIQCTHQYDYPNATCTVHYPECGFPPENSMHLLRKPDDPNLPGTGMVFGLTISSIWYWCSDQVIVQRVLSAKNLSHAKAGTILAGWCKMLPMWLIVLPGMISRILYPDLIACTEPDECEKMCKVRSGCTNFAYPMLVINLMPQGARGLMLAVMMSALMNSLTSVFNSCSTIFTIDIWSKFRKNPSEMEQLFVGRIFILFLVVVAIAWIPIVDSFAELWRYVQSATSFLAPPICAVFLLAVLWERTNEQGAFWALVTGMVTGVIRFAWESAYAHPECGQENTAPKIITQVHFLHFGILLFALTSAVCVIVSLLTPPIDKKHLLRLTYWTRYSREERADLVQSSNQSDSPTERAPSFIDSLSKEGEVGCASKSCSRLLSWICGLDSESQPSEAEKAKQQLKERAQMSLIEEPWAFRACAVMAVISSSAAVFMWSFFH